MFLALASKPEMFKNGSWVYFIAETPWHIYRMLLYVSMTDWTVNWTEQCQKGDIWFTDDSKTYCGTGS